MAFEGLRGFKSFGGLGSLDCNLTSLRCKGTAAEPGMVLLLGIADCEVAFKS